MKWNEIKTAFDWDGSRRDIYVLNSSIEDWRKMLDFIRGSNYSFQFYHYEEEQPIPASPNKLFTGDRAWLLSLHVKGIAVFSHFFAIDEIELDFDPREVDSLQKATALFEFMRCLGRILEKPVRLTPENTSSYAIFEYDPVEDEIRRIGE